MFEFTPLFWIVDKDPVIDLKGIAFEGLVFDQFHCVSLQRKLGSRATC